MAGIKLSAGFTLIPEGRTVFLITGCEYKEKFGKIEVKLETKNKLKHTERFDITNDGGLNAFSFLAKTALQDYELEEIDHEAIVGCYIAADVVHTKQPHRDDPNKTVTFVNLVGKYTADGFDDDGDESPAPKAKATPAKKTAPAPAFKPKYDLSFLDEM